MSKPRKSRHERSSMRYGFEDGGTLDVSLIQVTAQSIMNFARMALSDSPALREKGRSNIEMVAKFCVAGQFYLNDQPLKAKKPRGTLETDEGRTSLKAIVEGFANRRDALGSYLKPADLWPELFAEFVRLGLEPKEKTEIRKDKKGKIIKERVIYHSEGKVTASNFRSTLSTVRRENAT